MASSESILVREFLELVRARLGAGEVIVSVRDVMRSLGSSAADITACLPELEKAGCSFHFTDVLDPTLPHRTRKRDGRRMSAIGVSLPPKR